MVSSPKTYLLKELNIEEKKNHPSIAGRYMQCSYQNDLMRRCPSRIVDASFISEFFVRGFREIVLYFVKGISLVDITDSDGSQQQINYRLWLPLLDKKFNKKVGYVINFP
mmetsp:Transcript_25922/g.60837  ORF Transcript_25922/g.60837 Transcript_25922/m.60837 type:complete len:110 (+) Transcript_25922:2186-2515(+)